MAKVPYSQGFREINEGVTMKYKIILLFLAVFLGLLIVFLTSCDTLKSYPEDNFFEEVIEKVIEEKTGADIDLSPFSSED